MATPRTALFSQEYWDQAHAVAEELRFEGPVHDAVTPSGLPVKVVTRYDDARAALADPRLSKDIGRLQEILRDKLAKRPEGQGLNAIFARNMLMADAPVHTRLRRLLVKEFTPRRVEALRPRIEEITADLLDRLPADEPVDLVERFAFPLPITVIGELIGVPEDDRPQFQEWTAALVLDRPDVTLPASREMETYLADLIEAKRKEPGEDLLSALTVAADDGERLDEEELLATAILLLVAGHETTANLIGNGVHALLTHPGAWQLLREQPDRIPDAVEELLRYDGPVRMATSRFTTEELTIGGVTVAEGELVMISVSSANRDATQFDRADELDLGRKPVGHLTFGHGIHYCLGAPLARLEGEIAFGELVRRFPSARLAVEPGELRRRHSAIMNGHVELPLLLGAS